MLRGNPGIHGDVPHFFPEAVIVHALQLRAGNDPIPFAQNAQVLGDGGSGELVVAGNHDGFDTRLEALANRFPCRGTGRINHAHHAQEGQFPLVGRLLVPFDQGILLPHGKHQHPQGGI